MKNKILPFFYTVFDFFKEQFHNHRKRSTLILCGIAFFIGIIFFMIFFHRKPPVNDLKAGISYIHSLENVDISPIEKEIKAIKKEEQREAFENGELDVWQQFNDSVILGDSRAVGFSYYKFVPEDRVLASPGATIRKIPDLLNTVKTINPSSVFLCFGINDVSIGFWKTPEEYTQELIQMVSQIQEAVPDATIYVNSIIPATDPAFKKSDAWRGIPQWNEVISQQLQKENIPFIDISKTVEEHKDLYDSDGIHMQKAFYDFWAITMITEVNDNESE